MIGAVTLAWLALSLPADGFFSGDPGVKLIAAFNAIDHPARPFEIDWPRIGGAPVTAYSERFFAAHGDHAHALQSPVFPVLTAPLIAAFGLRGAYILPALSFLALIPMVVAIARNLRMAVPVGLLVVVAAAANPLFFYALEYWEHAPAASALGAATVLVFGARAGREDTRDARIRLAAGGAAGALAVMLRPEAAWYMAGLGIALWLRHRGARPTFWLTIGFVVGLAPFVVVNLLHAAAPFGPHVAANLAGLGGDWLAVRAHRTALWLVPTTTLGAAGAIAIALALVLPAPEPVARRIRILVSLAGCAALAASAVWGGLERDNLWQAAPIWPLAMIPAASSGEREGRRLLGVVSAVSIAGIVLTSNHDGGAQWGPRFLLVASPAMIVLASASAAAILRQWRTERAAAALVLFVLVCGVLTTRLAYRELRGAKKYYARLVGQTAEFTGASRFQGSRFQGSRFQGSRFDAAPVVVTDVWWLDQILAPLYRSLTILTVDDDREAAELMARLQRAGERAMTLVRSREESTAGPTSAWLAGSCFVPVDTRKVAERDLVYVRARCHSLASSQDSSHHSSLRLR